YEAAITQQGDATKGALLFSQNCIVCHQMRGTGAQVGPELSGIASRPKGTLLVDILNPSKEVSPDFHNYVAITQQGQVFTGLLVADTEHSIRLRRQAGAEDTILRKDLDELRRNGQSVMPEGFEEKLAVQDMANLLEFLQHPVPLPEAQTVPAVK
ncbi:MAG: c-type cytochrome, partial [Planctomycetota bacterium]|nr:c-type cytochrome [Planctomycetota bacterium]